MLFWTTVDGAKVPMPLQNAYAGLQRTACWLMGAGPSLRGIASETLLRIQNESPAARIAVNYAGRGDDGQGWLLRPTHWVGYDTTSRFSRSTFQDPTIVKFVRGNRHTDLIPDGTEKVHDCPSVYYYEMEFRKYSNFVYPTAEKVNDSLDSMVAALDIAYLLGFREVFLIGADMRIRPSPTQIALAEEAGSGYPVTCEGRTSDRLQHFLDAYVKARGVSHREACAELEKVDREAQYAFPETKSFGTAVACDTHYWQRVEYLRLSRKTFAQAGLRVVSCTPGSRLNSWFEYMPVEEVCDYLLKRHGDPREESTVGRYTEKQVTVLPWHKDIDPHFRVTEMKKAPLPGLENMAKREVQG